MEEGNVIRPSPLRPGSGSLKSSVSGKSSLRRFNSGRTPRRDVRSGGVIGSHWFRSNRVVLWMLLITLWAYAGFYFQSRWAHRDHKEDLFSGGYGGESDTENPEPNRRELIANVSSIELESKSGLNQSSLKKMDGMFAGTRKGVKKSSSGKKRGKKSRRKSRKKSLNKPKPVMKELENEDEMPQEELPMHNMTYRNLVGPFGSMEDSILEWSPMKRSGTCDRKGAFARLVWSRKFVLIIHELSMNGASLAMLELATEFLSCGATVSVIVLNKKGDLLSELSRRKIKTLEDKTDLSFKTAMKADLIIAGSASCSSWIERYLSRTILGSSQIMWWIMENRREYFDRTRNVLNRVKKLIFLSEIQSKQWLDWCKEEKININSEPALVPLSVNDELAFVAGLSSSLNTPYFTTEKMLEKRLSLRNAIRNEMGLADDDMLIVSLSSINPGKGQYLLLESARLMIEQDDSVELNHDYDSRALLQDKESGKRNLLSESQGKGKIKVLIGSVGSKSNNVSYIKTLLEYLSKHVNLSKSVLWTPETTRVASLYAAADVYVMNSQGLGETFGRVTIEAMAFGLPVLGTDCGGTKELVDHNVSGLLHPLGHSGALILARNLEYLHQNPLTRTAMGIKAKEKVERMYTKKHMYQKFGEVLYKCMRIK